MNALWILVFLIVLSGFFALAEIVLNAFNFPFTLLGIPLSSRHSPIKGIPYLLASGSKVFNCFSSPDIEFRSNIPG